MSRTNKNRHKQRKIIKNSLLQKTLHCYGEDIANKRKDRRLNRMLRRRLKKIDNWDK